MRTTLLIVTAATLLLMKPTTPSFAATMAMHPKGMMHPGMMVAYDAKDKRYYSVTYAKAHNMHDKGGDPLTIVPMSSLPPTAKMSRAMHGHM